MDHLSICILKAGNRSLNRFYLQILMGFTSQVSATRKLTCQIIEITQNPTCAQDFPGSNFTVESWGLFWIDAHVNGLLRPISEVPKYSFSLFTAAKKAGKPLILEEFGVTGLGTSQFPRLRSKLSGFRKPIKRIFTRLGSSALWIPNTRRSSSCLLRVPISESAREIIVGKFEYRSS
jgi:hypothetical protein